MAISFAIENENLICAFSGRMDTVSCLEVNDDVETRIEKHNGKIVFDLGEVDYISSSFLRICTGAVISVKSENFSIISITPNIKKVFMIAGLADKLNIQ